MSTWSGWQNQLLDAANIIVTPPNRDLLTLWAKNAHTNCASNPIDLSHKVTGSTQCATLPGIFTHAMNYTTHAHAATAFSDEIHASFAKALLDAMNSGNPYQVKNTNDVASVFVSWGTDKMLNVYLNAVAGQGTGSGSGSSTRAPHTHSGYHDLQHVMQKHLPDSLRKSGKLTDAALRSLSHGHKVKG